MESIGIELNAASEMRLRLHRVTILGMSLLIITRRDKTKYFVNRLLLLYLTTSHNK